MRSDSPHDLEYPAPWVFAGVCGGLLLVIGVLVGGTAAPSAVDSWISDGLAAGPARLAVAFAVDWLGEPVGVVLLAALTSGTMLLAGRPRHAVLVVLAQPTILVAGDLMKGLVGRTIHEGSLSYPSGHTAGAVAFALVLALFLTDVGGLRGAARPAVLVAAGLATGLGAGWAQVTVGAHYPTDTLGGVLLGFAVVPPLARAVDGVAERRSASDGTGPR